MGERETRLLVDAACKAIVTLETAATDMEALAPKRCDALRYRARFLRHAVNACLPEGKKLRSPDHG